MSEHKWPIYCGRCRSPVQPGDRFCAECGAVTPRLPPQAEQVIPEPVAAARESTGPGNRRTLFLAGTLGALLVLLVGGGAIALLGSGGEERTGRSGGQPDEAAGVPEERGQPATTVSAPPPEPTTTPEPATSAPDNSSTRGLEAQAQEAAEEYYRAAGLEDWAYTYEHLDRRTQNLFTREEWFKKNQWFADNGEVIYHVKSVERLGTSSGIVVGVKVRLTYGDGSSSMRDTYFVYEEGGWKHAFGKEERNLFMPRLSYEEFVEAQQ